MNDRWPFDAYVSFQVFYDELSPYGTWLENPDYGYVWVPNVSPGFVPYATNGYWVYTIEGWMWVSDYPWGWAPIGPGISINIAYSNDYYIPHNHWTFVRDRDFGRRNINNYYIHSSSNITIINNSTVINNTHLNNNSHVKYNGGPDRTEVERHIGKPFNPVAIRESSRPSQKLNRNELHIYRPQVQKSSSESPKTMKQQPGQQQRKSQPMKQHPLQRKMQ